MSGLQIHIRNKMDYNLSLSLLRLLARIECKNVCLLTVYSLDHNSLNVLILHPSLCYLICLDCTTPTVFFPDENSTLLVAFLLFSNTLLKSCFFHEAFFDLSAWIYLTFNPSPTLWAPLQDVFQMKLHRWCVCRVSQVLEHLDVKVKWMKSLPQDFPGKYICIVYQQYIKINIKRLGSINIKVQGISFVNIF